MEEDSMIDPSFTIETVVNDLVAASKKTPRDRPQDVPAFVTAVAEHAYERGLTTTLIQQLLSAIASKTTLSQSDTTTLIKNLFPAETVTSRCVLTIVSALGVGRNKASFVSQALLIRWLYGVRPVLEDPSLLARLYSVLWNLLDVMSVRAPLCQLLASITRRQHIKPFRIQHLYNLNTIAGDTYEVRLLCDTYKSYCPDLSFSRKGHSRPNAAAKSDASWRAHLADIRASQSGAGSMNLSQHPPDSRVSKQSNRVVPQLRTVTKSASMTMLDNMEDAAELVDALETIELPIQLAAALQSPLLQQYAQLRPTITADLRLQFWLAQCLDDVLASEDGERSPSLVTEVMSLVTNYVKSVKVLPSVVTDHMHKYLSSWDGVSDVALILDLLTYLPGISFSALHREHLSLLESRVGRYHPDSLNVLSRFYASLLKRRVLALQISQDPEEAVFISDLQAHVSTLHLSALVSLSEGNATVSSIVRFYETLAHLSESAASSPVAAAAVILPSPLVVFLMVFAFQLDALSRLCAILTVYKAALETGIKASVKWPANFTNRFNGCLMDICNLLWRSRAFTKADTNSLGCLLPDSTAASLRGYLMAIDREYALASLFGISHNMLLASFSLNALQGLEREQSSPSRTNMVAHVGPASQRTLTALEKEGGARILWKDFRVACLRLLHEHGISGVRDLMYATMRDLAKPT